LLILIVGILLSSVYFFILSQSGLLERINLEEENKLIHRKIEQLKNEKNRLQNNLRSYRLGRYTDNDLLESGYTRPGEKIIFFKDLGGKTKSKEIETTDTGFSLKLTHLRLIWIAFSGAVLLVLLIYGRRNKDYSLTNTDS
jgi:hypothetical protein